MSTSGVTLIPVIASSASLRSAAGHQLRSVSSALARDERSGSLDGGTIGPALPGDRDGLEVRQQHVAERLGVGDRPSHDALERVERGDGRDGDEDPDRRRDERLGDAGHDRLGRELRRCAGGRRS